MPIKIDALEKSMPSFLSPSSWFENRCLNSSTFTLMKKMLRTSSFSEIFFIIACRSVIDLLLAFGLALGSRRWISCLSIPLEKMKLSFTPILVYELRKWVCCCYVKPIYYICCHHHHVWDAIFWHDFLIVLKEYLERSPPR